MNLNKRLLTVAMLADLAPQGAPRDGNRPHIEPVMRLAPVAGADNAYELLIYGDIGDSWWGESVTAQSVAQQLNDLDKTVDTINVRINSYGGSVADGLAIYNALKRHGATKAVTVDGVAMSSASLIAMAGDTVEMPPTSMLMIHAPWGGCMGNAKEMRQYADVLDQFSAAMTDAYVVKSGQSKDAILALLTDGEDHYYTGEEAVAAGFADKAIEETTDDPAIDESARAFGAAILDRIAARRGAPGRQAIAAMAAAMRGMHSPHATTTKKPDPAAESRRRETAASPPNPPAIPAEQTTPADAGNDTGATTMTEDEKKAAAKAALAADKARREAIRAQFNPFLSREDLDRAALDKLRIECEDDTDATPEAAGAKLLAFLGKNTTPSGGQRHGDGLTEDETKNYREGAIHAVMHRIDPAAHKHDGKSQQFRGLNLLDLARDSLERAGKRTRGMSGNEIAIQAMQTTSDFPNILENVVTKSLRMGYQGAARTFVPFSRQATLPNFKEVSRAQLGGAPNLKRVLEGAEYEHGTVGDGAEKYAVQKYGRIVALSWETIVNDDLDALSRIPQAFGASAAELESDIVYAILTGNPAMADGDALFHANHKNLGTAAALKDALDPTAANPIGAMRKAMTLQKGLEGQYITVRPRYLIVPPSLEEVALKITSANFVASKGVDQNVFGPSLIPISEPRLEDDNDKTWYGAAEPSTIDTIEYAYLEGHEGVFTETKNGFEVDGVQVKCRHVFGAKAIDFRGLYKNPGA